MSNALKSAYNRVILPYEIWLAKQTKTKGNDDINKEISPIKKEGGMKRVQREPGMDLSSEFSVIRST
jgi:hypothetical protein